MESLQNIKRRIAGVKNIGQITKAMELVAATKMRKSQEVALASRPYAYAALELLANLSRVMRPSIPRRGSGQAISGSRSGLHPLLEQRVIKRTAVVVVTSDKGLAGSFNAQVLKKFEKFLNEHPDITKDPETSFVGVGQKAAHYIERRIGRIDAKFVRVGDYTTEQEVLPIAEFLTKGYLDGTWDRVIVFSMVFRSALKQEVVERQLFPVDFEAIRSAAQEVIPQTGKFAEMLKGKGASFFETDHAANKEIDYLIEPSPEEVIEELVSHLVLMQLYHLILEANASEHAARRAAMKSASDNAEEVGETLTVDYNKSRQAAITRELTEITAGAEALK